MTNPIENACFKTLYKTVKALNPMTNTKSKPNCEVHIFIQDVAFDILTLYGYKNEYALFNRYRCEINKGIVWADEDFKSRYHSYKPNCDYKAQNSNDNALTLANKYYENALRYYKLQLYEKSMFYFGATCHLVQDLTVPQHAKATLLDNHIQYEAYVKASYKKYNSFISNKHPLILDSVDKYINYNARYALHVDKEYRYTKSLNMKFYSIAVNCITLAQETSAGCMIMFYNDLYAN